MKRITSKKTHLERTS